MGRKWGIRGALLLSRGEGSFSNDENVRSQGDIVRGDHRGK